MTSLTGYFQNLMQSQGATDTLLVSDDAAVLKTRSYPYLPTAQHHHTNKTQVPSKFTDSCAVSSNRAPNYPSRKGSAEDLGGERLDSEKKFKATLTSDDIDDMCVNVMRKHHQREHFHQGKEQKEKRSERSSITSADLENDDMVREIVSMASNLLNEKMSREFAKEETLIRPRNA